MAKVVLSVDKLPIKVKQTRWGYLHYYTHGVFWGGLGIGLMIWLAGTWWWFAGIIPAVVGLKMLGIVEIKTRAHTMTIHRDKITISYGAMSRSHKTAPFHNISDLHTHQTFKQRLFGYGTLQITTQGGQDEIDFYKLKDPHSYRDFLLDLAHDHTVRMSSGEITHTKGGHH